MDDLVQWYVKQLDADERLVKEQRCINCDNTVVSIRSELGITGYTHGANEATPPGEGAWEGRRCPGSLMGAAPVQNPDHFLREVEAKRRSLVRHAPHVSGSVDCSAHCERAHPGVQVCNHDGRRWPCPDVLDSASVYADRPGFQESWRP